MERSIDFHGPVIRIELDNRIKTKIEAFESILKILISLYTIKISNATEILPIHLYNYKSLHFGYVKNL